MDQKNTLHRTLQTFFDSAPMLMGMVEISDNDIIHISDNKTAADFFGYDQKYLEGKKASELGMPAETISTWLNHYRESQRSARPVHFDYWHHSPKGSFHFTATVAFIEVSQHGLSRFSYIVQDTTEAMQNQITLRNQSKFLGTVLDNIPDMIFVKDAQELRFLKFNKAGEDLIGIPRDELLGKNDFDLFPESEATFFTTTDRKVFEQGKVSEIPQEPIATKHRGTRILHTKKIPLYDSEGRPQYLVGISADITDKLAAVLLSEI